MASSEPVRTRRSRRLTNFSISRDRLLIIDADLPKRLGVALEHRGRRAVTASKLKLAQGVKDGPLLRALAAQFGEDGDWVLVTGDDNMPAEHGPIIVETRATVATVHPERPEGLSQHYWRMDVVQRFAHQMQKQEPQSVRRYTDSQSKVWTPRRRHILEMARSGWVPWRPQAPADAPPTLEPPTPEPPPPRLPGLE